VLLGQRHGALNLCGIGFEVLLGVVGGVRPRTGAIDPRAEHHVHLEGRIRFPQFGNGLHHVRRVRKLHVVGAQEPDPHGVHQAHVLFQLVHGRLLGAA